MTVHTILKMGDPRLLRVAPPVTQFDTPELHALVADMFETMHAAKGVGLAAPQIGIDLQLVVFGTLNLARVWHKCTVIGVADRRVVALGVLRWGNLSTV